MKCAQCKQILPKWELHLSCWKCRCPSVCRPTKGCGACADFSSDDWIAALHGLRKLQAKRMSEVPPPTPSPSASSSAKSRFRADRKKQEQLDTWLISTITAVCRDLSLPFSLGVPGPMVPASQPWVPGPLASSEIPSGFREPHSVRNVTPSPTYAVSSLLVGQQSRLRCPVPGSGLLVSASPTSVTSPGFGTRQQGKASLPMDTVLGHGLGHGLL